MVYCEQQNLSNLFCRPGLLLNEYSTIGWLAFPKRNQRKQRKKTLKRLYLQGFAEMTTDSFYKSTTVMTMFAMTVVCMLCVCGVIASNTTEVFTRCSAHLLCLLILVVVCGVFGVALVTSGSMQVHFFIF